MKVVELGMVLNDDKSGEGLGRRQGADVQLQCRVTMCHTHTQDSCVRASGASLKGTSSFRPGMKNCRRDFSVFNLKDESGSPRERLQGQVTSTSLLRQTKSWVIKRLQLYLSQRATR